MTVALNFGTSGNTIVRVPTPEIDPGTLNLKSYSESQVRVAGCYSPHVDDLIASIEAVGQQEPVTLERLPGKVQVGKPVYRLIDGSHRFSAICSINKKRAEAGLPPLEVVAVIKRYNSSKERLEEQLRLNNKLPALGSSDEDIVDVISKLVKDEGAVVLDDIEDSEAVKRIKQYITDVVPGLKKTATYAKKVFEAMPSDNKKIRSYTKDQAVDAWNRSHSYTTRDPSPTKLEWAKSGSLEDGIALYFCDAEGHLARTVGQVIQKRIKTSPRRVVVCCYMGSSVGKDPDNIVKFRENIEKEVRGINSWVGKTVIDELWCLPQIVSSSKHAADVGLIKVDLGQ